MRRGAFFLEMENWSLQVASLTGPDTLALSPAPPPGIAPGAQPTRRFVRVAASTFEPPRKRSPRFPSLRLPSKVTYQEIEGQPDFYDTPPVPTLVSYPDYPEFARDAGIQGRVLLHVLVGSDSTVLNIRTVRSVTGLTDAAHNAMRHSRFVAATENGRPVAAWTSLWYDFRLP
jgi:TonB family protein